MYICTSHYVQLKGQYHEIFCFGFFHESSSPKPLKKFKSLCKKDVISQTKNYVENRFMWTCLFLKTAQ
jgi:hypothetical protein